MESSEKSFVINKKLLILLGCLILAALFAWLLLKNYQRHAESADIDLRLPEEFARLQSLFTKPGSPQRGDWLERHPELGQTYQEYLQYMHIYAQKPAPPKNVIYMQPLGDFTAGQKEILDRTADFLGAYFALPVRMLEAQPLPSIPDNARRKRDSAPGGQLLTHYLLRDVLKPLKPEDVYILVGFVADDISPGGSWNYVFGQAAVKDHIAICSLARICPGDRPSKNRTLCLRRTLKLAAHEIGHLFSLEHCIWYLCNMAGNNSLEEMDRNPLELCPHCMAKICFITGADPKLRMQKLRDFYIQNGLDEEQKFCDKLLTRLQGK